MSIASKNKSREILTPTGVLRQAITQPNIVRTAERSKIAYVTAVPSYLAWGRPPTKMFRLRTPYMCFPNQYPKISQAFHILTTLLLARMVPANNEGNIPDPGRLYPVCCAADIPGKVCHV